MIQVSGQVIAANSLPAPGVPGTTFASVSVNGPPVIDASGGFVFAGTIQGGGVTAANATALFAGTSSGDVVRVIGGGDPAPGIPGVALVNSSGVSGIGANPTISPNGSWLFSGRLSGTNVTSTNDSALFTGLPGAFTKLVREGEVAPGTVGAMFGTGFSFIAPGSYAINEAGQVLFQCETRGGDTNPNNDEGLWSGFPGAIQLVQRRGNLLAGHVIQSLGFPHLLNQSGQVVYRARLSTLIGSTPASLADDETVWVWTPGQGHSLLAREGDPVPGMPGTTFSNSNSSWTPLLGWAAFNAAGEAIFSCPILGGSVIPGLSDQALFAGSPGSLNLLVQRGDSIAGGTVYYDSFWNGSLCLNGNGDAAFIARLAGAGTNSLNDSAVSMVSNGVSRVVAREGDVAPGTVGATFSSFLSYPLNMNDKGQLLFRAGLIGGDVTGTFNNFGLFAYDPEIGVVMVARRGDAVNLGPGLSASVLTFGIGVQGNGGGASLGLNHDGDLMMRVSFSGQVGGVVRTRIGSLWGSPESISEAAGGVHTLVLNGGHDRAGQNYLLAGSISGISPGFTFGGFNVPLNPDPYFNFTVGLANTFPLSGNLGVLDGLGFARATVTAPPGLPMLAGLEFHHAFATVDSNGALDFVSEPARLLITP